MLKRFHVLMDEAKDGSEGSGGGAADDKGAENQVPSAEELLAKIEALSKEKELLAENNKKLLDEKKNALTRAEQLAKEAEEKALAKATEVGDTAKLAEILKNQNEQLKSQIEEIESKRQEKETSLLEEAKHLTFEKMFKDQEFHNVEAAKKLFDFSKLIPEKTADGKMDFNSEGKRQAEEEFRQNHAYLFKPSDAEATRNKAKGVEPGKDAKEEMRKFVFGE